MNVTKYSGADDFEVIAGERIQSWIDDNFTFENGLKRKPDEDDYADFGDFDEDQLSWMFTQRGEKLYQSYVSKANKLGAVMFPEDEVNVENYTGVIYA